jgi:(p)ppGpp synthase/HD superfamily hydrolase
MHMDRDHESVSLNTSKLMDTPLHVITKELGAEGLEQRFRLEVESLELDDDDKTEIIHALDLALTVHLEDKRGEDPYSTHFMRVATRIITHFKVTDKNTIVAALLHDTVEDRPLELITELAGEHDIERLEGVDEAALQEAALYLIAHTYDPEVADIIDAVTNPEFTGETREERQEEYREHVRESLKHGNPKARIVKASDLVDNFAGLRHNPDKNDVARRAPKYLPLIPDIKTAINQNNTPLNPEVKQYLTGQLEAAEEYAEEQLRLVA